MDKEKKKVGGGSQRILEKTGGEFISYLIPTITRNNSLEKEKVPP